jgi:hypothetical protein
VRGALGDLVDGEHFFDIVANDIVYEALYDFPGWPRVIQGRVDLIDSFRVRHVWATWHVMAGTTMVELRELGAWKSGEMVRRYAHLAPEQLRAAADNLATFSYTPPKNETQESTQAIE